MDKHRGELPRGTWVRQILWRELLRLGEELEEHVREPPETPRTRWKREQERKARERREWKRLTEHRRYVKHGGAKGQRVRRVLARYEGIEWVFRDADGGVVASDVVGQDAGRVDTEGVWHGESRHSARVVAWAVGRVLQEEPERLCSARWRKLWEREGRPMLPADVGEPEAPGVAARRALAEKRKREKQDRENAIE